jgi:hypothetical protein
MARNLKEEIKALQDAIEAKHGLFMALEGDNSLRIYPNADAWTHSETSALLLSRCYNGKWEDREQFLIWGQGVLDKKLGQK